MTTVSVTSTLTISTQIPTTTGYAVESGGTLNVISGGVVSGQISVSGGFVTISSGGVVLETAISSGGTEVVQPGGTESSTTVISAGTTLVSSGATAHGNVISGVGLTFASGTDAFALAIEIIAAGGTDLGVQIAGYLGNVTAAEVDVYGLASAATDSGGLMVVEAGGTALDTTVINGEVLAGFRTSLGVEVLTGGENVFGIDSGAQILAFGQQHVESGGVAVSAELFGQIGPGGGQSGGAVGRHRHRHGPQ